MNKLPLILCCACLSACTISNATKTTLAEPNVPLIAPYQTYSQNQISDTAAPSVAQVGWQQFYSDEKLKALIALGLQNNKTLQDSALASQKVAAQYQISQTQQFPMVGTSAAYQKTNAGQSINVGLGLTSYEIDFWGKIAHQKQAAYQNYLASTAAHDNVQIGLIANIAATYVNLSYALAQLELAKGTQQSREHSLFITQKRFEAGIDSKAPSLQASSSLQIANQAVIDAQKNIVKMRNQLQYLVGAPIDDALLPEPALNQIVSTDVFSLGMPSQLLQNRPDIIAAEHALYAAGANIAVARAAYYPSISLSGNLGLASHSLSNLFDQKLTHAFGLNINLPIFDAGYRSANVQVSQIAQEQALVQYERAIQNAFKEVHDVLADQAAMQANVALQYDLQNNLQQSYDIAYATYRAGLSGYLDVLDAERSLFSNQQQILAASQQAVLSQIELYKVLGGGVPSHSNITMADETQIQQLQSSRSAKTLILPPPITQPQVTDEAGAMPREDKIEEVATDGEKNMDNEKMAE